MDSHQAIHELIDGARNRWRRVCLSDAAVRGGLGASVALAAGLLAAQWADRSPLALIAIIGVSMALASGVLVWALVSVGQWPSNRQVARFIEERAPALDDRLVT